MNGLLGTFGENPVLIYWEETFLVTKEWDGVDADDLIVHFKLYRVDGGAATPQTGSGVPMPDQLKVSYTWQDNTGWDQNASFNVPVSNGFFEWNGNWYLVYQSISINSGQVTNGPDTNNNAISNRLVKYTGRIWDLSEMTYNQNGKRGFYGVINRGDLIYDSENGKYFVYKDLNNHEMIWDEQRDRVEVVAQLGEGTPAGGGGNVTISYASQDEAAGFSQSLRNTGHSVVQYDDGADASDGRYTLDKNNGFSKSFKNLPAGTFYAVEVDVYKGSENVMDQYAVTYEYDQNGKTVTIKNAPAAGCRVILRKSSNEGDSLAGAIFDVETSGGSLVKVGKETLENLRSGTGGVFWIGDLPVGTYWLHEKSAPSGYEGNSGKYFKLEIALDESSKTAYANPIEGPFNSRNAS